MNNSVKAFIKTQLPPSWINAARNLKALKDNTKSIKLLTEKKTEFSKEAFPVGINLIGSLSQESGLGQGCRLLAETIEKTEIPHAFIDFEVTQGGDYSNKEFCSRYVKRPVYGVNVFQVNMHEFARAYHAIPQKDWKRHYNIAFWSWENEEFPKTWIPLLHLLDEVWTPADFDSNAIRSITKKPVRTVPYHVTVPVDAGLKRSDFGLPDNQFLFLMLFDYNSVSERKNPMGVIRAFRAAFKRHPQGAGLVIKITNADQRMIQRIKEVMQGYEVYFVNEMLSKKALNALIQCVDVYVSLHRAEGYGLVLAEAMALGVPTIATGYSANTEFQNSKNSCLVRYSLKRIGKDIFPYKKDYLWAEPDIRDAAHYMRKLRYDPDYYESIREQALNFMSDEERAEIPVTIIREAVKEIYDTH